MGFNLLDDLSLKEKKDEIKICKNKRFFDKIRYTKMRIANFNHKRQEFLKYFFNDLLKETFLVKRNREIIGILSLKYDKNRVYLFDFAVNSCYRNQGFGTLILNRLLLDLKKFGYAELCLYVFDTNKTAMQLYEKVGFQRIEM